MGLQAAASIGYDLRENGSSSSLTTNFVAAETGTSIASRLSTGTEWASGKLPLREGPADGLLIKRGPSGEITNYSEYDSSGYITKRVDLTGRSHAGIATPYTVDYVNDVSPSGQIFPRGLAVRPATPGEIP